MLSYIKFNIISSENGKIKISGSRAWIYGGQQITVWILKCIQNAALWEQFKKKKPKKEKTTSYPLNYLRAVCIKGPEAVQYKYREASCAESTATLLSDTPCACSSTRATLKLRYTNSFKGLGRCIRQKSETTNQVIYQIISFLADSTFLSKDSSESNSLCDVLRAVTKGFHQNW